MFISVTIHILSFHTLPFTAVPTAATMQYADLDYECAVYWYQKNIAVLKVAVLYTMGLLNQWY